MKCTGVKLNRLQNIKRKIARDDLLRENTFNWWRPSGVLRTQIPVFLLYLDAWPLPVITARGIKVVLGHLQGFIPWIHLSARQRWHSILLEDCGWQFFQTSRSTPLNCIRCTRHPLLTLLLAKSRIFSAPIGVQSMTVTVFSVASKLRD